MTDLYDYHNGPNLGLEPTTPRQVTYQNGWLVPGGWKLVPEELIDFLDAKEHHLPVEDRHVLSIMLKAAPDAAQASGNAQDAEDAARWRYIRRKLCLTGNGDGTCAMQAINLPAAIQGWPEPGQVAEFCDAAIDAAMQRTSGDKAMKEQA